MYIKIRMMAGKMKETVITVSKTDPVDKLKKQVEEEFGLPESKQRLFFHGKQLESGYTLHDYKVNVNDVILVMEKVEVQGSAIETVSKKDEPAEIPCESEYFRIGDIVDAIDVSYGAWFDGKIIDIVKCQPDYEIYYKVQFFTGPVTPTLVLLKNIRPVARTAIPISTINKGDTVMVNYNSEDPDERGFWYDFKVGETLSVDGKTIVQGTLFVGIERTSTENIAIIFPDEMMQIETNKLMSERTTEELQLLSEKPAIGRKTAPICKACKDNPMRKCDECGCNECGGKEDPEKQLVCDECEYSYHISCLDPPLETLPEVDDWYCNNCRNDESEVVKAGEKLKASKKKTPASSSKSKRDWGRGMACVGTTKKCSKVPQNHFGPIPGIEVGMSWLYRIQVSEEGIHRPPVGGMHGRDNEGAYSIVLSGGYEDDIDDGDEFLYTGAGGRDLSGNKRTAEQSCDQELKRTNKALALNCCCKFDAKNGGDAGVNWKKGKPVRVVRNAKLAKHSKYAPKEGNRYDGIYKVVKYFPVKGQSGFVVWRYQLRRDDPAPAPWTKDGKERIASLGLQLIYPENWQEVQAKKNQTQAKKDETKDSKAGNKRKNDVNEDARNSDSEDAEILSADKKMKISCLDTTAENLIKADEANAKVWADLLEHVSSARKVFLDKVEEAFSCVCCMGLVYDPITTACLHNVCKNCLKRSYNSKITSCPYCRHDLGRKFDFEINENLSNVLHHLFPGYTAGC